MAADAPLAGYEPNLLDIPEDDDGVNEIFTDPFFTQFLHDSDTQQPDPVEIDDEHPRERTHSTTANAGEKSKHRPESNSITRMKRVCDEVHR